MIANKSLNVLLIISFLISIVCAINRNNTSTANKNILKLKVAEPRDGYGFIDGYGAEGLHAYGKSEYYWLIPLVIVIGFGALLLPLLGTLMTTMITTGTINLTAGRRKREINIQKSPKEAISEYMIPLLSKLEEAVEKFGKHINSEVSPLLRKLSDKKL